MGEAGVTELLVPPASRPASPLTKVLLSADPGRRVGTCVTAVPSAPRVIPVGALRRPEPAGPFSNGPYHKDLGSSIRPEARRQASEPGRCLTSVTPAPPAAGSQS